jgi:hypothetical protein
MDKETSETSCKSIPEPNPISENREPTAPYMTWKCPPKTSVPPLKDPLVENIDQSVLKFETINAFKNSVFFFKAYQF